MRRVVTGIAVLAALLGAASPAWAEPGAPLGHQGRWITDTDGRVVILHGVNMVYKRPPYAPDAAGFGDDDAAFLEANGFNTVRLGLIYKAVEPAPGSYDEAYLDRIAATERNLASHGVFTQLDFHQDMYNERFQGEGWPDWAVQDDGLPAQPQVGFPGNLVVMVALWRAFDHFWANDPGPGGVGLQDRYAAAFRRVAERFRVRRHTIGYDLMNEPWPGSVWPTCANPLGCPLFDIGTQAPFHRRVIARIREVEPQKLIWYEPSVTFNFGADSSHPPTGDGQTGFSFHVYCLPGAFGVAFPGLDIACDSLDGRVLDNADKQAQETGDALLLSEYGATDDLATIERIANSADEHMVSWQYWHYCGCDDPTTQGPGVQAVVLDANQPPSGDNVKQAKLDVLSRPYPQAVAGTPERFSFDRATRSFELSYATTGPSGRSFVPVHPTTRSPQTEIFIPARHYPSGYDVDVEGAGVASAPNAGVLRLVACPGAARVAVRVSPQGEGAGDGPDCAVAGPGRSRGG